MNTTGLFGRRTIILLVVMIASATGVSNQLRLVNSRKALEDAKGQLASIRSQLDTADAALLKARAELGNQNTERDRLVLKLAKSEREFAKIDPEARWVAPPASLPEWNSESPFVWLRKDMVSQLPVAPFMEQGQLRPEIGYLLTLDAATQQRLNQELKNILTEYRDLEAAKAELTDEHLPGIAGQQGEKITVQVRPQPADGARLKTRFETALKEAMGNQRAELLTQAGDVWINSEFAQFGSETKTVSLIRNRPGSYNISIKSGGNWFSTGGPADAVLPQIPVNLRPMFAPLLQNASEDSTRIKQ
jgi:hypothetical protein